MFTGMVVERGAVRKARRKGGSLAIEVDAPPVSKELSVGDSVAVNGVCLTATSATRRRFSAEAMPETLARSTLSEIERGDLVNLELPARLSDRLGGHIVQGHVDGVGRVIRTEEEASALRVWLATGEELLRFMVPKGSVALDGVSLTVVEVGRTSFQVALIPHTLAATTLGALGIGSTVNLEADVIAKYVDRLTSGWRP